MIWHFLEVWALLLAAFAIGGAVGTLVYMGLAVSPLADAQIATADAIADRIDALRDAVGRRRDTGLYRGHHESPPPAFVAPFPVPAPLPEPEPYADPDSVPDDEEPYGDELEELVVAVEAASPEPVTAEAEDYWEDDEWAPDEDDVRWAEDYVWSEEDETEAGASASIAATLPEDGTADEAPQEIEDETAGAEDALPDGAVAEEPADDDAAADRAGEEISLEAEEPADLDDEGSAPPDDGPDVVRAEPTATTMTDAETASPPESDEPAAPAGEDEAVVVPEAAVEPPAEEALAASPGEVEPATALEPVLAEPHGPALPALVAAVAHAGNDEADGAPSAEPVPVATIEPVVAEPVASVPSAAAAEEAPSAPMDGHAGSAVAMIAETPAVPPAKGSPSRRAAPPKQAASAEPATRPLALPGPRNGVPDNLQRIRGIGQKNEELLNALGVYHFGQIAAWTPAEARWIANQLAFPERLERDDWVGQAIVFATGGDTGYVKAPARRGKDDDESPVAA